MRISVLASGSGGNAVLIATERTRVLLDAGVPVRETRRRAAQLPGGPDLDKTPPDAVLLTHEHGDHARAAVAFAELGVPVCATGGTLRALDLPAASPVREIGPETPHLVGDLVITSVPVPHDAAEPVGFIVSDGVARAGLITDCGHDDAEVARRFAGLDVLILEFNHDEMLLRAGPYPPYVKRRIGSDRGHLSNRQAASLLRRICAAGPAPRVLVLAHLSSVNNRPRVALAAALDVVRRRERLIVADQNVPTPWLDPAAPDGRAALPGEQLTLKFLVGGAS